MENLIIYMILLFIPSIAIEIIKTFFVTLIDLVDKCKRSL
jgi:hypothetical protein